ncbi:hypothetical protein C8Q74DRAFT_1222256 [Fomes fomentarius]|nr:hypothetical protein C8Q74DRAFT_1222256 [Fomes fomentarius]
MSANRLCSKLYAPPITRLSTGAVRGPACTKAGTKDAGKVKTRDIRWLSQRDILGSVSTWDKTTAHVGEGDAEVRYTDRNSPSKGVVVGGKAGLRRRRLHNLRSSPSPFKVLIQYSVYHAEGVLRKGVYLPPSTLADSTANIDIEATGLADSIRGISAGQLPAK